MARGDLFVGRIF